MYYFDGLACCASALYLIYCFSHRLNDRMYKRPHLSEPEGQAEEEAVAGVEVCVVGEVVAGGDLE